MVSTRERLTSGIKHPPKTHFLLYGIHGTNINVIFMIDNLLLEKKRHNYKKFLVKSLTFLFKFLKNFIGYLLHPTNEPS